MKEQYYIDWINSLDIKNCVFVNKIEDLYQSNNKILSDIIAIILNKNIEDFNNEEKYKNLNYLEKISIIMNEYFQFPYEINDEINLKNNTILLIKFLKSKYPNVINEELFKTTNNSNNTNNNIEIKERPKSSKNIKNKRNVNEKKYNIKKIINENIIQKSNYNLNKYINKNITFEESKNNESTITYNNKTQIIKINKEKKMEEFILNYLYKKGIINSDEKNNEYLWKKLIPELKDGYIIGKLINLLENKCNNYLKDISQETFYKVNINLNWKKIKEFLIKKEAFNSLYLYQKNFYEKNINIFYLLYDICKYYYTRKELKDNKKLCKRSFSVKNNKNEKMIKKIKEKINMDNISSKEEIIKVRQSINNIINNINNKINKNILINKNIKKNKTEINYNINNKLNNKIKEILSFLSSIGIDTSQINFNTKEMKIFKDGILLYKIISQLESNKNILPKIDLNPKQAPNAINNHRLIINYLIKYKNNFPIKYIEKEKELYKANSIFILNFLFAIKNAYKNEIYFYEKINNKSMINKIYHKNIDKSERLSLPLDNKLRNKFIIKDKEKIWA